MRRLIILALFISAPAFGAGLDIYTGLKAETTAIKNHIGIRKLYDHKVNATWQLLNTRLSAPTQKLSERLDQLEKVPAFHTTLNDVDSLVRKLVASHPLLRPLLNPTNKTRLNPNPELKQSGPFHQSVLPTGVKNRQQWLPTNN